MRRQSDLKTGDPARMWVQIRRVVSLKIKVKRLRHV